MTISSIQKFTHLRATLAAGVVIVLVLLFSYESKPRLLAASEVPIAYWAWLGDAPSADETTAALAATNSRTLFLRSGQFDSANGRNERIRPTGGRIPKGIELHLSYNATRRFLRDFESLEPGELASQVIATFNADIARARDDGARIHGLQLDFDVPNRLLPTYGAILRAIRESIPSEMKLSVTGLPAWTDNPNDLQVALEPVDFWIPQCYGGTVPTRLSERIPIASASEVARTIASVRRIGKPFYAGLSSYGYTILYSKAGELVELRGDIDPALVACNTSLDLVDRRSFGKTNGEEVRYEYVATRDVVISGLIIEPGQTLVVDQPSSASLRATARAVRENAGELLIGISIFRLPSAKDKTVLSIDEIRTAINDIETIVATELTLETKGPDRTLELSARNSGTATSLLGSEVFTIDIEVPAGRFKEIKGMSGFSRYETLCRADRRSGAEKCSTQRANIIRLRSTHRRAGDHAVASLDLGGHVPPSINANVTTHADDGRVITENFELFPKTP